MVDAAEPMESEQQKLMKVRIPAEYQVKLRMLKVLTGTTMSEVVLEALELYFEENDLDLSPEEVQAMGLSFGE